MQVRDATHEDVADCVKLIEARRRRYAEFEPRFWRKAENSAEMSTMWFAHLFASPDNVALVAVEGDAVVGFIIATNFPAPPVVDLGGKNALVDDFAVEADERWADVGPTLLAACKERLRERGYVQIVVVGAAKDEAKMTFLGMAELSLASTWWTGSV